MNAHAIVFRRRPTPNPVARAEWDDAVAALHRFEALLDDTLRGEHWEIDAHGRLDGDDPPGTLVAVVQIRDCPGRGDFDRKRDAVLRAFEASGLSRYLYFDGTDYGPLGSAKCPWRGYHFYDASLQHPAGLGSLEDAGYIQASAQERAAIDQAMVDVRRDKDLAVVVVGDAVPNPGGRQGFVDDELLAWNPPTLLERSVSLERADGGDLTSPQAEDLAHRLATRMACGEHMTWRLESPLVENGHVYPRRMEIEWSVPYAGSLLDLMREAAAALEDAPVAVEVMGAGGTGCGI